MLGRQQIAGIPSAFSELFKNAHDAYATHVEVDFYRPEGLLVLRDNGLGMTPKDVEERWLTIGTESKLDGGGGLSEISSALGLKPRIPTGEKGIGRLAIATIGPQVLLVTRARRIDGLYPTVASFINWSLFALPGISLDEIEIPIIELPNGELPTSASLASLVDSVARNLDKIRHRIPAPEATEIEKQLEQVNFDVSSLQRRFQTTTLGAHSTGTHFYVQPTDPMLQVSLDTKAQRRRIGDLQLLLMGFTDTMMPNRDAPPIVAAFRDHHSEELSDSVIGPDEFFTPSEYESADHHFQGEFDEYGQFIGTVSIYGGEPEPHAIAWPESRGRKSECGPFSISFAHVQGAARESRIPPEERAKLISKLDSMGGLYIYRNGIRILPYGNPGFDFIGIEQRRTLGASYYFFSYRRMFGAIDLPSESSARLVEKAGREGFRDNRAYRDFRSILENFYIQLAADYFRDDALWGEQYRQLKEDFDRQSVARERRERHSRTRRRNLVVALEKLGARMLANEPKEAVEEILSELNADLQRAMTIGNSDEQIDAILLAEDSARQRLSDVRKTFRISQPRGVGLSRALRRDLTAYRFELNKINEEVFEPGYAHVDSMVRSLDMDVDQRRRFDAATQAAWKVARTTVMGHRRASEASLRDAQKRVREAIQQATTEFEAKFGEVSSRLQSTNLEALSNADIVQLMLDIDAEIESVASEKSALLETISQQLESVNVVQEESGGILTHLDTVEATEEELIALQDRAEADLELTQLGMAIEIIDHEFQATIRSVRNNLRRLSAWADVNEQLRDVYNGIRVNFEHLDGYLTLFTPLHRRLYRSAAEIKGSEIHKFLTDLFSDRLARHSIEIEVTRAFLSHQIIGYPSTFYPVFVNLLDNSIFWLQDRLHPRIIRLNSEGDSMLVSDNGPGVQTGDRDTIFEMGFTRKPGGRGLGLYISRDVLNRVGYDLKLASPEDHQGTVFRIQPRKEIDAG